MKFRFWGVRGSIPSPGPLTVRYGGNTTCIEVRSDAGTLIVLDAGTGIYQLARELTRRRAEDGVAIDANIFISHSHWDHIHGLPFFTPLFSSSSRVCLHGARDQETGQGIEHVMAAQLKNSYFPVSEERMGASIGYVTLEIGVPHAFSDVVVHNVLMNHPVTNLGYRIECNGKSLFFSGDHEAFEDPAEQLRRIEDTMRGVDALVMDCSYTIEEYPAKRGWGHGTFDAAIELALKVGARALYCTHHEPTRSDDELEEVFGQALGRWADRLGQLKVVLAYEGLEVDLG